MGFSQMFVQFVGIHKKTYFDSIKRREFFELEENILLGLEVFNYGLGDHLTKMLNQRFLHFWEAGLEDRMLRMVVGQHFLSYCV